MNLFLNVIVNIVIDGMTGYLEAGKCGGRIELTTFHSSFEDIALYISRGTSIRHSFMIS